MNSHYSKINKITKIFCLMVLKLYLMRLHSMNAKYNMTHPSKCFKRFGWIYYYAIVFYTLNFFSEYEVRNEKGPKNRKKYRFSNFIIRIIIFNGFNWFYLYLNLIKKLFCTKSFLLQLEFDKFLESSRIHFCRNLSTISKCPF